MGSLLYAVCREYLKYIYSRCQTTNTNKLGVLHQELPLALPSYSIPYFPEINWGLQTGFYTSGVLEGPLPYSRSQ